MFNIKGVNAVPKTCVKIEGIQYKWLEFSLTNEVVELRGRHKSNMTANIAVMNLK